MAKSFEAFNRGREYSRSMMATIFRLETPFQRGYEGTSGGGSTRELSDDIKVECSRIAAKYGVSDAIGSDDFMFWFFFDHLQRNKLNAIETYFRTGADSALTLNSEVRAYLSRDPVSLLEFASGYGRVTRHLPKMFPSTQITACDVHPAAMAFIRNELRIDAEGSSHDPETFRMDRKFEVVFALSFFSHMPADSWEKWLGRLASLVLPNGLLIFSTHGLASAKAMGDPPVDGSGFWFTPSSEQKDLSGSEYGNTITTFDFVYGKFRKILHLHFLKYQESFWAHQDHYVFARTG
jgi:SAM-dependent methyltransferase